MSYSINEAFKDLRRKRNLNEDNNLTLNWVERIHKLLRDEKLSPDTLEEFISEHERGNNIEKKEVDLLDPKFNFAERIEDEFEQVKPEGWFRTDMLFETGLNAEEIAKQLDAGKRYRLGIDYYVFDTDGMMILISDDYDGLTKWLHACDFESDEEALKYYNSVTTNISSDYFEDYIQQEKDYEYYLKYHSYPRY